MGLKEKLKERRAAAGLTQKTASDALGVKREMVSMWESGSRVPGLRQLEAVALLYRSNVGYLLGEEPLDQRKEHGFLYGALDEPEETGVRLAVERWLRFLDGWAGFLEDSGEALPGASRPPRDLDEGTIVVDARRAQKLATAVREHYGLGARGAAPDAFAFLEEERGAFWCRGDLGEGPVSSVFYNHPKLGFCLLVDGTRGPDGQTFAAVRGFAHALFHYPAVGVVSRVDDPGPKGKFAEAFAADFLVPRGALRDLLERTGSTSSAPVPPNRTASLAGRFAVSTGLLLRCAAAHGLAEGHNLADGSVSGRPSDARFARPAPAWGPEYRYPGSVLGRIAAAVDGDEISVPQAAGLLDVDRLGLQTYLRGPVAAV